MEGPAVNVGGEAAPETVVVELAFKGSNEENEIETLDEFLTKVDGNEPASLDLSGWVFQAVDFSTLPAEQFLQFNFSRASLWGCVLPDGVNPNMLRAQGAVVLENPLDVPFKAFRGFMYRQEELAKDDAAIYQWYLQHGKELQPLFAMTTHDYSIKDALYDYLEGKTVVSIMGGHGMSRSSDIYCNVTKLAWRLAREGFLMVTGGGPGAMEAANMGAYLKNRPEEEVNEALAIIATGNGVVPPSKEFTNVQPALSVIERFGPTTYMPSIGIPTWRYGHEPSNVFATFHAKMFSNAVREDGIIAVSNGGIIFTPGSAGTRQEIFQDACYNHYSSEAECCPMVFYPAAFWKENGVFDLLKNTSVVRRTRTRTL